MPDPIWKTSVTVAAVIERDGRYLLVEEHTPDGLMLNNPAGHLDPGESPIEGVMRETLEESARGFTPDAIVGVYLSRAQRSELSRAPRAGPDRPAPHGGSSKVAEPHLLESDVTFLRLAFTGSVSEPIPGRALDSEIVRTLWLTPDELRACPERHRSPLLMRCIDDHRAGRRFPLDLIYTDPSVRLPLLGD